MEQVLGVDVVPTVVKEPVMDVPSIDMRDTVVAPKNVSAPARKKSAKGSAVSTKRPGSSAQAKPQAKRTRDGSVGRDTFEQVEALVKQGKNKSEAFKQIAEDTGRNVGTVSANYYRVARASGAVKPRQRRGKALATPTTRRRQSGSRSVRAPRGAKNDNSIDQIVTDLVASVQSLAEAVKAQDAEVREIRGRLEGVSRLLR